MTGHGQAGHIAWVDAAKAYGIGLVFYGHFVERMFDQGYASAFPQFKLIYAFHVPLFFILAGYVQKERDESFGQYLRRGLATRLAPALFFNLLAFVVFVAQGIATGTANWKIYLTSLLDFLRGYPSFNFVTWFLVCLFTVEIIHFCVRRYVKTAPALLAAAIGFLAAGGLILAKIGLVVTVTGIALNTWFIHEALIAYGFYQLGMLARQTRLLEQPRPLAVRLTALVAAAIVVLVTFNLNAGPFTGEKPVVLMAESAHGFMPLFALTAVAGALAVAALAQLTPAGWPVAWVGQNTLALMGLDGLLHNFINFGVAGWLRPVVPDAPLAVLLACAVVTVCLLAGCAPAVALLNRYLPRWIGQRASK
ncbi:MAG: hypothetical protein NT169_17505 [Chloroflexi bacterium]|nr:hypothetical protein [Chloroflexota bacterium]